MPRITLLTDFRTADGYAAAIKGVIASIVPGAVVEDASHEVPPGDVRAAAWALDRYWHHYPDGSVHLVVVDPGVGGLRQGLAVAADGHYFVGPDNGVFTRAIRRASGAAAVSLEAPEYRRADASRTFHGRDIFAPAAAHLARGEPLERFGPPVPEPVLLEAPRVLREQGEVVGEVVHVDRFGNLITEIPASMVHGAAGITVAGWALAGLAGTYSEVPPGEIVALIGSAGTLEIAVRDGSAAALLGAGRGAEIRVRLG